MHQTKAGVRVSLSPWEPPASPAAVTPVRPVWHHQGLVNHESSGSPFYPGQGRVGIFMFSKEVTKITSVPLVNAMMDTPDSPVGDTSQVGNARNEHFAYSNLFCPFPLPNKGEEALGVRNGKGNPGGSGAFPSGPHCAGWSSGVPAGMAVPVPRYGTKGMNSGAPTISHFQADGSRLNNENLNF